MAPPPDLAQAGIRQAPMTHVHEHPHAARPQLPLPPGTHPGMPPPSPAHHIHPMAGGHCIASVQPTGAVPGPSQVASASRPQHWPGERQPPAAQLSWQGQQSWAHQQHNAPPQGAVGMNLHAGAPGAYGLSSSSVPQSSSNGGVMGGPHPLMHPLLGIVQQIHRQ